MADFLGHSDNLISLSGTRSAYKDALLKENSQSTYFNIRAYGRECMAFFVEMQGKLCCFYPLCL